MSVIALLSALKGLSIIDVLVYTLVLIIAGRMGYLELRKRKPVTNPFLLRHCALFAELDKLVSERMEIKYQRVLTEQTRVADSMIESDLRYTRDMFFKALEANGYTSEDILEKGLNKHYLAVVEILGSCWRKDIVNLLKENRLTEKSEAEFRLYMRDKFETFLETRRLTFDTYYSNVNGHIIHRHALFELHKGLNTHMREKFEEMFRECRIISAKAYEDIAKIEARIDFLRGRPCSDTLKEV